MNNVHNDHDHVMTEPALLYFCEKNNVEFLVYDLFRTHQRVYEMRRPTGGITVIRFIDMELIDALMINIMAKGMLRELIKREEEKTEE